MTLRHRKIRLREGETVDLPDNTMIPWSRPVPAPERGPNTYDVELYVIEHVENELAPTAKLRELPQ